MLVQMLLLLLLLLGACFPPRGRTDLRRLCLAQMMSRPEKPAGAPVSGTWKSVIPMEHYNVSYGKSSVDAEMPKGKRIIPRLV